MENERRGRILVRGGRRPGALLGPDAAPLVKAPPKAPEVRRLQVGDLLRALGKVYRVQAVVVKNGAAQYRLRELQESEDER